MLGSSSSMGVLVSCAAWLNAGWHLSSCWKISERKQLICWWLHFSYILLPSLHQGNLAFWLMLSSLYGVCIYTYSDTTPFHSSPQVGFLRFLNLLSSFDWKNNPLIVNLNGKLTGKLHPGYFMLLFRACTTNHFYYFKKSCQLVRGSVFPLYKWSFCSMESLLTGSCHERCKKQSCPSHL